MKSQNSSLTKYWNETKDRTKDLNVLILTFSCFATDVNLIISYFPRFSFLVIAFFGSLALTIIRLRRYQCNTSTQHQNNIVKTSFTSTSLGGGGDEAFDSQGDCLSGIGGLQIDKNISEVFHSAITFHSSWSFYLGWLGITGCLCSSICVFTLSKLMRNGPYFAA